MQKKRITYSVRILPRCCTYDKNLFQIHHTLSLPGCTKCGSQQWYGIPDDLFQLTDVQKKMALIVKAPRYGMIGVIIHEVGHNFFPMIINSDERQWSWMDEGLNTFVQYLTEELWDNKFPSRRGPAYLITDYMKLPKDQLEPIMSNSENIVGFGPNAYSKPATGLNILRETIMGRELFDYAFKEYARRWAFKHPEPADFFRTLEDASGEDLDWFWRGWFYGTDACDISLDSVKYAKAGFEYGSASRQQREQ